MADDYPRLRHFDFELPPALHDDLRILAERARRNPGDIRTRNLLQVASNALVELKHGHPGTKRLAYMPSYPDLSDCRTMYVGADPNSKPSHRIVFRDVQPETADQPIRREIVALGKRERGQVYHIAGQRLGRPIGLTLSELNVQPEPLADHVFEHTSSISDDKTSDFHFG